MASHDRAAGSAARLRRRPVRQRQRHAVQLPNHPTDAPLVEWDLPSPADFASGAITVDVHSSHKGRLWFVSRVGVVRLFRFEPGSKLATQDAKWKSFQLQEDPPSTSTGGLHANRRRIKVHKNDQQVFVRTHTSPQRIDTGKCTGVSPMETCERTTWLDQIADMGPDVIPNVSDLSMDDCHVYTTTALFDNIDAPLPTPELSYLHLPLTRSDRSPPGGAEASEINLRCMCAIRDGFKHPITARQRAALASAMN